MTWAQLPGSETSEVINNWDILDLLYVVRHISNGGTVTVACWLWPQDKGASYAPTRCHCHNSALKTGHERHHPTRAISHGRTCRKCGVASRADWRFGLYWHGLAPALHSFSSARPQHSRPEVYQITISQLDSDRSLENQFWTRPNSDKYRY